MIYEYNFIEVPKYLAFSTGIIHGYYGFAECSVTLLLLP